MQIITRALLWSSAGALCLTADVITKAAHHELVVNHHAHTPAVAYVLVSVFLYLLGVWHSRLFAVGAGMMFGGLCGNGGELMLKGYATDWIPVGGWLTNVADIAGLVGLVCCFAGYIVELRLETIRVG